MGNDSSSNSGGGGSDNSGGGWTNDSQSSSNGGSGGSYRSSRCEAVQNVANAVCDRGSDTSAGFSGGSEIGAGVACLSAQSAADKACGK